MDVFGDDYIAQHCIQEAHRKAKIKKYAYYIADGLYCASGNGKLQKRYCDLVESEKEPPNAKEVVERIKSKFAKLEG